MDKRFQIKLYYSRKKLLYFKIFTISDNTSIKDLCGMIDITSFYPEFDNQNYFIGVFGKIKSEDYIIQKEIDWRYMSIFFWIQKSVEN